MQNAECKSPEGRNSVHPYNKNLSFTDSELLHSAFCILHFPKLP